MEEGRRDDERRGNGGVKENDEVKEEGGDDELGEGYDGIGKRVGSWGVSVVGGDTGQSSPKQRNCVTAILVTMLFGDRPLKAPKVR